MAENSVKLVREKADGSFEEIAGLATGNARGAGAIDLQTTRIADTQVASGLNSVIDGGARNTASGDNAHAEGLNTTASAAYAHAEGYNTTASSNGAHAEGFQTEASNSGAHAEGQNTESSAVGSHAEGSNTTASGNGAHAEGVGGTASGISCHVEGSSTAASGDYAHAEGLNTTAGPEASAHAEGYNTIASGTNSHAEGYTTRASGTNSHAEGITTSASGMSSHAEGSNTSASGISSHAEGINTIASGTNSHAEGSSTRASGSISHAEGINTTASGPNAHAEGVNTSATNTAAHAEGNTTAASGQASHAAGENATASHDNSFVWSDGEVEESTETKQFTVRATNGTRLLGGKLTVENQSHILVYDHDAAEFLRSDTGERLAIPENSTFSMEFDVLYVAEDYSVSSGYYRAVAQNNGGVTEGIGEIAQFYMIPFAKDTLLYGWYTDGIGGDNLQFGGPALEVFGPRFAFDTDSDTGELVFRGIADFEAASSAQMTIKINAINLPAPGGSSGS